MKRLLVVLLLVNVVYLIAHQFSDQEATAGIEKEADKDSVPQANFLVAQEAAQPAAAEPEPEPEPEPAPSGEAVDAATSAVPGADAQPKKAVEPPVAEENSVATTRAPAAVDKGCLILGPFSLERQASRAIKAVEKFVESAELTDRDSEVLPDYLVYVGPEASSKLASNKAAEFKAQGFDSQIIRSGVLKNVVSLGVFSRRPLADSLMARVEAIGQTPKIRTLRKNRKGYQVNGLFLDGVRDVLKSRDFPYAECTPAS